jgi:hypothetical protein
LSLSKLCTLEGLFGTQHIDNIRLWSHSQEIDQKTECVKYLCTCTMWYCMPFDFSLTCVFKRYDISSNSPSGGINEIVLSLSNLDSLTHWLNLTSSSSTALLLPPARKHKTVSVKYNVGVIVHAQWLVHNVDLWSNLRHGGQNCDLWHGRISRGGAHPPEIVLHLHWEFLHPWKVVHLPLGKFQWQIKVKILHFLLLRVYTS